MRLLLVEDDPTTNLMMTRLLTQKGYRVSACSDAETALDLHCRNPFPFILLDLGLPCIDGIEFTRRIRMGREFFLKASYAFDGIPFK